MVYKKRKIKKVSYDEKVKTMRKTIVIAGAAGEGINTVEMYTEKLLKKAGYDVYAYKNYMSRIRGGYNYSAITIADHEVFTADEKADWFVAMNGLALENAQDQVKTDALVIAPSDLLGSEPKGLKVVWLEVPKQKNAFGMAALGYLLKTFGIEDSALNALNNAKWTQAVNQQNMDMVKIGYDLAQAQVVSNRKDDNRIVLNGNQAVALGALSAGLGFFCAYPMAPSTGIMNYLAANDRKTNIIVEQVEDEIAAAMGAIGAASNGVRAMTATSGGGFSLMVESLGFAAVGEVPVVICNVQRPGPATGLPTRTEQADLSFVVTASQGEFSRIVLAPRTIEDSFYTTFRAFNLADKYQVPVIILTDQLLADSVQSIERFQTQGLEIERHLLHEVVEDYKRYDMENLYGNRKYPGIDGSTLIMTDSHVHDPYGYITEEAHYAIAIKDKFLNRNKAILKDLQAPLLYGDEAYETLFICWGSTYGALKEAVDGLNEKGHKVALLSFTDVFPLDEEVLTPYLKAGVSLINVEGNGTNQFGKLLRMETGVKWTHSINKYDGRPFTRDYIIEAYEVIKNGK